jgi:hypothetical protein
MYLIQTQRVHCRWIFESGKDPEVDSWEGGGGETEVIMRFLYGQETVTDGGRGS